MTKWLVQALIPLACAALALVGVAALGRLALERLRDQDRYAVAFADIDCAPPPGMTRGDFLDEVQFHARQPDRLRLLDADLAERLSEAFARHPWVEEVKRVTITPPREVRVELVYRKAVLAVPVKDKAPGNGTTFIKVRSGLGRNGLVPGRAVDCHGVLLPIKATEPGLPVLYGDVPAPAGPEGSPWGDVRVEEAARTADFLRASQDRLELEDFEVVRGSLVLSNPAVRVIWGHAPGAEPAGEAKAAVKLARLLEYQAEHGSLSGPGGDFLEHDVRPPDQAVRRPLPSPDKP